MCLIKLVVSWFAVANSSIADKLHDQLPQRQWQSALSDFSRNRADGDDILGDAYEYLMRHFATASGKSKGHYVHSITVACVNLSYAMGSGEPFKPHR